MIVFNTEHWQKTLIPGAARKVIAMAVCVQKRTQFRAFKITATSPIQLRSRNVSSEKKTVQDRATVSDVTPKQIIFDARDVNRETAVPLPNDSAHQQALNIVRSK